MDWRVIHVLKLILKSLFTVVASVDVPQDMAIRAFVNTVVNFQLGRTVTITLPDKMIAGLSK